MCSYAQSNKLHLSNSDDAYFLAKKHKHRNSDSAYLDIEVLKVPHGKHSKQHRGFGISDVWLNNHRYDCDSAGRVKIAVKPGKIELTARSLGLKSISHTADVKKGELMIIKYYLGYF
jgi:ribosomal protein L30/L7E